MPRAKDLDLIAPDDPVTSTKKRPPSPPRNSTSNRSKDQQFHQKVYKLIKRTTKNSFSSFLARPKVFTFESRDNDEEIILVLRRHWLTNVPWMVTALLMLFAPLSLLFFPILELFPDSYHFVLALFWYLLTFASAFEKFLSWYFNVFIITEERVIDIDFFNLLDKKMSEAKISMIQDVTATTNGVAQTLFSYGTVFIQTASEIPVITIDKIPNPNLVLQVLQQMRSEEEQEALEGRLR